MYLVKSIAYVAVFTGVDVRVTLTPSAPRACRPGRATPSERTRASPEEDFAENDGAQRDVERRHPLKKIEAGFDGRETISNPATSSAAATASSSGTPADFRAA